MTPKQMVAKRMVEISGGQLTDCYAEIEVKNARIAELEAALAPFAAMIRPNTFDPKGIARFGVSGRAGNDDYRAAYAALNIANDKGERP